MSSTYTVPAGRYGDTSTAFIQAYIDQKIAGVIDLAPETLDSLSEIAAAIGDDANFVTTINDAIQAVQDDVNANETAAAQLVSDLQTARALVTDALAARLDALEVDPTTSAAVTAVQSDVDQVEAYASTARGLLSDRIDVLEVDPTTQAAVTAVQNDVDANEVDRKDVIELNSNITQVKNSVRGTRIDVGNNIALYPAAGGRVEVEGGLVIDLSNLEDAADDTAAAAAGVIVGGVYRNGSQLMIRVS
nr:hypothetical protein 39 [bacterium]